MRICSVDGCSKKSVCKSFCGTHYTRYKRCGSPLLTKQPNRGKKCIVDGCLLKSRDNAMCGIHAQRVRKYGNPHYVTPESVRIMNLREAQPRLGNVKRITYKKYLGRHEHRVVMERVLGRKLLPKEIVHHIDGNRHNNLPSNLSVMTQSEHASLHFRKK